MTTLKPWTEMTRSERLARIGPTRDLAAVSRSYNDELVRRFNAGLPLTKSDRRDVRRLLRDRV